MQGSKFGSYRRAKLLELIIQSSPQELLTHFIFFNLKEWYYLSRNLLSPRNIIHQQIYDISQKKRRIRCLLIYCFLFSIPYTDICLIASSLSKKNWLLGQTILAWPSEHLSKMLLSWGLKPYQFWWQASQQSSSPDILILENWLKKKCTKRDGYKNSSCSDGFLALVKSSDVLVNLQFSPWYYHLWFNTCFNAITCPETLSQWFRLGQN